MPDIDPQKRSRILLALETLKPVLPTAAQEDETLAIKQLINLANNNGIINWNMLQFAIPSSQCHHQWMEFAHLVTLLWNRFNSIKVYSVLRQIF